MNFSNWFRRTPSVHNENEIKEIRTLCTAVTENIRALGHEATAFGESSHARPKNLEQRIAWMKAYNEILEAQAASEDEPVREKDLMWKFLAKMRYAPTSDIFDRISDGQYIEIYDLEGDQVYRSLNYFDMVSFSIDDILNLNWKRHYKRNGRVNLSLLGLMARVFTGQFKTTYDCMKVPVHQVSETIAGHYVFELNIRYISPLKQNGKCVAAIVVSNTRRLKPA